MTKKYFYSAIIYNGDTVADRVAGTFESNKPDEVFSLACQEAYVAALPDEHEDADLNYHAFNLKYFIHLIALNPIGIADE